MADQYIVGSTGGGGGGSGTVTEVDTGTGLTGGPITTTGTVSLIVPVAIANGGTNATTAAAGFNHLSPMTTAGDIIYGGASGAGTRLGIGSTNQVLTVVSGAPAWAASSGSGTVTSVATGTGLTGGPITTTGTVSLTVPVVIANGGTNATTAGAAFNNLSPMTTVGDIIIGGTSGAGTRLGIGSSTQVLTVVSGSPAWAAASGGGAPTTATYLTAVSETGTLPNSVQVLGTYTGTSAWAIDPTATASSTYALAFGHDATASTHTGAIAIGGGAATGSASSATGAGAIAIGSYDGTSNGAKGNGANSIAIGTASICGVSGSIAIGYGAVVNTGGVNNAVALGASAVVTAVGGSSFGYNALAAGVGACAIGYSSQASGNQSVCLGQSAQATTTQTSAFGYTATASSANATALGFGATASAASSVAIGDSAAASGTDSIAIGQNSTDDGATNTFSIGKAGQARTLRHISHLIGGTAAPTVAAGTGAGTSPTVTMSTNSTDLAGQLSVVTGSAPAGSNAVIATITFDTAYGTAPWYVFSPANANAASVIGGATEIYVTSTTTTLVFTSGTSALTAATTYLFNYFGSQ